MPGKGATILGSYHVASAVKNRILYRTFSARAWLLDVVPGRCPGLICDCPFGATTQKAQHQNLRVGLIGDPRLPNENWKSPR